MNSKTHILVILIFLSSCGVDKSTVIEYVGQDEISKTFFSKTLKTLKIKVFYEEGSEPYTGNSSSGKPVWDISQHNIESLLKIEERGVTLTYPKDLSEMNSFESVARTSWSAGELYQKLESFNILASNPEDG